MDSKKHNVTGISQSNEVACSFSSFPAVALIPPQTANMFIATIANAFSTIAIIRANSSSTLALFSSPYRISRGMLNTAMANLTKYIITNPLNVVTKIYGFRTPTEHIFSVTRSIFGLLDKLKLSFTSARTAIEGPHQETCTLTHLNQLATQLQQLAENVANLQETNEASRSENDQENLLAELEDMKGYLELLYQQLKSDEQRKLQMEEENLILRQAVGKHSPIEGYTSWDISDKRELDSDRLSNSFGPSHSTKINIACPYESTRKNPPASIETSMDEFGLKISCLYEEGTVAWARPPRNGDTIVFTFDQPVLLRRFKIGTGHFEYPTNKLREATVEILRASSQTEIKDFVVTSDDYLVVGQFDQSGLADGIINWHSLGTVQRLRVKLHCDHQEWIIISELSFEAVPLTDGRSSSEEDFESW